MRNLNFPNFVTKKTDFFDRENDLEEIDGFLNPDKHQSVVIAGERRMGKSSMLYITENMLKEKQLSVIKVSGPASSRGLESEILQGICYETGGSLRDSGLINDRGELHILGPQQLENKARVFLEKKPNAKFVVSIDEMDTALVSLDNDTAQGIIRSIDYLIHRANFPICFLFTINQYIDRLVKIFGSPVLNSAKDVQLSPWSEDEARQFIGWLIEDEFEFTEAALKALYDAAGGHPFFTKAILRSFIEGNCKVEKGHIVNYDQVHSAVEEAAGTKAMEMYLSNMVDGQLSEEEIYLLIELAKRFEAPRLNQLDNQEYHAAARRLLRRGYLKLNDQDRLYHRFGLFEEAIKKSDYLYFSSPSISSPSKGVVINETARRVYVNGAKVPLTNFEYQVLLALAGHAGKTLTIGKLNEDMSAEQRVSTDLLKQSLSQISEKISYPGYVNVEDDEIHVSSNVKKISDPDVTVPNRSNKPRG